jgi:hypothetical protein
MSEPQSHPLFQDSSCAIGVGELELSHLTDVDSSTFLDLEECAMFIKSERRLVENLTFDHSFCTQRCGHGVTMVRIVPGIEMWSKANKKGFN